MNFGAGFDTLYWKLLDANLPVRKFVEIDFANVTSRKCHYIKNSSKLIQALRNDGKIILTKIHPSEINSSSIVDAEIRYSTSELHSGIYHLTSADLRKLTEVESKLMECAIDYNVPTLFVFECVLVYMPVQFSNSLLKFIADKFSTTFCINYEQVNNNSWRVRSQDI